MAIRYFREGETGVSEIKATQKKPRADYNDGRLAVSEHRIVYESGATDDVIDISPDAVEAMEYTKQSLWNQWTAGGLMMLFLTFVTQALFGFLNATFEGFTQLDWLWLVPVTFMLFGLSLLAYGVLARQKVLKVRTSNTVYEFSSTTEPKETMHAIRDVRSAT